MISIRALFFGKSDSLYRPANLSNLGDSDFPLKELLILVCSAFHLLLGMELKLPGSLHVEISDLFFSVYAFIHFHPVFYF